MLALVQGVACRSDKREFLFPVEVTGHTDCTKWLFVGSPFFHRASGAPSPHAGAVQMAKSDKKALRALALGMAAVAQELVQGAGHRRGRGSSRTRGHHKSRSSSHGRGSRSGSSKSPKGGRSRTRRHARGHRHSPSAEKAPTASKQPPAAACPPWQDPEKRAASRAASRVPLRLQPRRELPPPPQTPPPLVPLPQAPPPQAPKQGFPKAYLERMSRLIVWNLRHGPLQKFSSVTEAKLEEVVADYQLGVAEAIESRWPGSAHVFTGRAPDGQILVHATEKGQGRQREGGWAGKNSRSKDGWGKSAGTWKDKTGGWKNEDDKHCPWDDNDGDDKGGEDEAAAAAAAGEDPDEPARKAWFLAGLESDSVVTLDEE